MGVYVDDEAISASLLDEESPSFWIYLFFFTAKWFKRYCDEK
jgi:hypothetical protein